LGEVYEDKKSQGIGRRKKLTWETAKIRGGAGSSSLVELQTQGEKRGQNNCHAKIITSDCQESL